MAVRTDIFKHEVKDVLENHILKFWAGLQGSDGSFYDELAKLEPQLRHKPGDVMVSARILWAFSLAYQYLREKKYLIVATKLKDFFLEHFQDHKFGGVYKEIGEDGKRIEIDTELKAQAITISALSRFFLATGDNEALKSAINLFEIIEKGFYDEKTKSYAASLTREFKEPNGGKQKACLGAMLMLLNGYRNLYRVWKDEGLRDKIVALLGITAKMVEESDSAKHKAVFIHTGLKSALATGDFEIVDNVREAIEKIKTEEILCNERGPQPYSVLADLYRWKYLYDKKGAERALTYYEQMSKEFRTDDKEALTKFGLLPPVRMCLEFINIFE